MTLTEKTSENLVFMSNMALLSDQGGGRFKVIEIELEDVETDTNNWKQTSQCLYR